MNTESNAQHVHVKRMPDATSQSEGRTQATPEEVQRVVARFRKLTWLLDNLIGVPGTKFRIGLDPILGAFPGAGDAVSAGISLWMIYDAKRLGLSQHVLLGMGANVGIDFLLGLAPVLGDGLDFFVKANTRNLKLLEKTLQEMGYELEPDTNQN